MTFRSLWLDAPHLPWPVARLKDHVTLINGFPFDSHGFNDLAGTPVIRIRDLLVGRTETLFDGSVPEEVIVCDGDLIVGMDGDFNSVTWLGGRAALNQRLCLLRAKPSIDQRFLAYVLPLPLKAINDITYFTTVKHLSSLDLLNERIPLPPLSMQREIAEFLDTKTDRIDALIEKKQQMAELLRERAVVDTQEVVLGRAKGLTTAFSGIESVGDVPSNWRVIRNKVFMQEVDERSTTGDEELLTVSHITGVTRRAEKDVAMFMAESLEGYKLVAPGDLVVNTMWAWMGALGVSSHAGVVSPSYNVYRIDTAQVHPRFVDALFRSPAYVAEITRMSKGVWTSRLRLYPEVLLSMKSPVPPLAEQQEIVMQLDGYLARLKPAAERLERSVAVLREHRRALVTAAVTGQLDVSKAAA